MTTLYEVLRRPLITEKSNFQSGKLNQYAFEVATEANRTMVKDAIETLFDVKVESVNIITAREFEESDGDTSGARSSRGGKGL